MLSEGEGKVQGEKETHEKTGGKRGWSKGRKAKGKGKKDAQKKEAGGAKKPPTETPPKPAAKSPTNVASTCKSPTKPAAQPAADGPTKVATKPTAKSSTKPAALSQSVKPQTRLAEASAAQRSADDCAWEEIVPMMADLLADEARTSTNVDQKEVFRRRCDSGPFAAVAKGRFLKTLKLRKDHVKDLANRALALSTVKAHKRMLRFLTEIPEKYCQLNLDRAMEQYFLDVKATKRWLPTTMMVKMATAHGALRLLPLYAEGELPVMMRESVLWMSAMKGAAKMAKQHPPTQPTAATWKEVEEAISKETNRAVRMALLLTWLTCGRGGDALLLKPSHVELTDRETKGGPMSVMSVSFWKGKTVKTRGSYTVFTQPPPEKLLEEWQEYHRSVANESYLFKGVRGAQIKDALRRANPKLEQRSLRRGAIQALAATGLKDDELLHYSGHTNVAMLRRYLNFGKVSGEGPRLASQALALVQ